MPKYQIREESGASEIIEAGSLAEALDAARDWAAKGSYDTRTMVRVWAEELDADGELTGDSASDEVEAGPDPEVPPCSDDSEHEWESPEWLGGCRENPGVWSPGGTRLVTVRVCRRCGTYRRTRHAGAQRNPGELETQVEYLPADANSLEWVREQ